MGGSLKADVDLQIKDKRKGKLTAYLQFHFLV